MRGRSNFGTFALYFLFLDGNTNIRGRASGRGGRRLVASLSVLKVCGEGERPIPASMLRNVEFVELVAAVHKSQIMLLMSLPKVANVKPTHPRFYLRRRASKQSLILSKNSASPNRQPF